MKTDWFELKDARLQLNSFTDPHLPIYVATSFTPSGPMMAGKHGAGLLSVAGVDNKAFERTWGWAEEAAQKVDLTKHSAVFPQIRAVGVDAAAGCQVEELCGLRRVAPLVHDAQGTSWTVELAPYDLLAARTEQTALHEPAGALAAALSRLARLAERLLALARADGAQALADDWVDLSQVVRLTVDEFSLNPRLRGRRMFAQAAPVRVRGDLDAIGLALRNLVENAIAHGADGSFIRVTCAETREGVSLAVTDDGPGVAPAELPSLM
jgi:alkanesulfonate monooxygenase SsuD/methylene tetrahydromethanopterin reductase-like flavin-dependent oxidoreductase (luciferase family)